MRLVSVAQPPKKKRHATRRTRSVVRSHAELECASSCVHPDVVARARVALANVPDLARVARRLRALGDPTRLRLAAALSTPDAPELCVCDLAAVVGASQSVVSHSLRRLRHLGVVQPRRQGKVTYYRLADALVPSLLNEAERFLEDSSRMAHPPRPLGAPPHRVPRGNA